MNAKKLNFSFSSNSSANHQLSWHLGYRNPAVSPLISKKRISTPSFEQQCLWYSNQLGGRTSPRKGRILKIEMALMKCRASSFIHTWKKPVAAASAIPNILAAARFCCEIVKYSYYIGSGRWEPRIPGFFHVWLHIWKLHPCIRYPNLQNNKRPNRHILSSW